MTRDEISARPSMRDRAKIEATTEEDIISPRYIRKRLGMSQQQFADTLNIPVATLRNWEQNRVAMEPATVALMRILAHEPKAALRALRRHAA